MSARLYVEPNFVTIPISHGKAVIVDRADEELVRRFSWCAARRGRMTYAQSRLGGGKAIYLHRFLLGFPARRVDHRNRNGLDCRRSNLREATPTQNGANLDKTGTPTSSTYKGVCWDKTTESWKSSVSVGGRLKHLGRFDWEVAAALAYDKAALAEWGEFARPNFPTPEAAPGNLLIVGHGRGGKDTVAQFLHGRGNLRCAGSFSWFALPFIAAALKEPEQKCWEERHAKRQFWFEFCNALRANDPLFLARRALQKGNVVTGLRDRVEMDAAKASGLFSAILWVERPGIPVDPTVKFTREDATDMLINDGSLEELEKNSVEWAKAKGLL